MRKLSNEVHKLQKPVDLLIHNAAIQCSFDFTAECASIDKIETELSVNLLAPIELTLELLHLLEKADQAQIVFISSALGRVPKKSAPVYCTSKAGISAFARTLRYQLEETSIGVVEVVPDLIKTRMAAGRDKKAISVEEAASRIVDGVKRKVPEIHLGRVPMLFLLHRIVPSIAYRMLKSG